MVMVTGAEVLVVAGAAAVLVAAGAAVVAAADEHALSTMLPIIMRLMKINPKRFVISFLLDYN
jgi:hypothetical protein